MIITFAGHSSVSFREKVKETVKEQIKNNIKPNEAVGTTNGRPPRNV